jgi:DNA repair photolyase
MISIPLLWGFVLSVKNFSIPTGKPISLLAHMPFVTLSVSVETDLLDVHRRFTHSSAVPERRLEIVREALARGIFAQVTVSPLLPYSPEFADRLAEAVGERGRVIIDTFFDGDGSGGARSTRLGMSDMLAEAGYPGWFERCREHAYALEDRLVALLGADRVLWSAAGFARYP